MTLRRMTIFDGPLARDMLQEKDLMSSRRISETASRSWLSVWWWMTRTFSLAYRIERGARTIGFIGACCVTPGESAEVSLVISDKGMRRRGYGTKAFYLLSECILKHSFARELVVRVRSDNPAALLFWKNLGFSETNVMGGAVTMSKRLTIRPLAKDEKQRDNNTD